MKLLIFTLAEEIVEGPVTQTQQVVNTSDQHVVDTGEVEKHIIHEKINQVTRHVEIPLLQITLRKPLRSQGFHLLHGCRSPTRPLTSLSWYTDDTISHGPDCAEEHREVPPLQITVIKVVDISVKLAQRQISRETVGQKSTEIPQLRYCDQVVDVPVNWPRRFHECWSWRRRPRSYSSGLLNC